MNLTLSEIGTNPTVGSYCTINALVKIGDDCNIRSHTVVYPDVTIGDRFQTGHCVLIRSGCVIGDDVSVGSHSTLEGNLTIGSRVRIHSMCFIPELTTIGDDVWIGPKVCFTNDKYPGKSSTVKHREGVTVEHDAVIGANVTILPGVRIGHHALIGAGAVVTHDVASYATVVGNPARPIYENR